MAPIHGSQIGYISMSRVDAIVDPEIVFDLSDQPDPGLGQPGPALQSASPPVHRLSVAPLMVKQAIQSLQFGVQGGESLQGQLTLDTCPKTQTYKFGVTTSLVVHTAVSTYSPPRDS